VAWNSLGCLGLVKTLLICHHDAVLDRIGLARWLASFSELVGVVDRAMKAAPAKK